MGDVKIALEYESDEDEFLIETVWAIQIEENYKIDNIPFYATSIALNDIVSAEFRNGQLYYTGLVEASGHSVVQIIFFSEADIKSTTDRLIELGCSWEGSHHPTYIAVDIPPSISYASVRAYLDEVAATGALDYKEACLGFV